MRPGKITSPTEKTAGSSSIEMTLTTISRSVMMPTGTYFPLGFVDHHKIADMDVGALVELHGRSTAFSRAPSRLLCVGGAALENSQYKFRVLWQPTVA
jgi:hypothetical protein